MNSKINSIWLDWREKVPSGVPNPSNDYHLALLKEVCLEQGIDQKIVDNVILVLEKDESKLSKADQAIIDKEDLIWKRNGYGPKDKEGITYKKQDGKLVPVGGDEDDETEEPEEEQPKASGMSTDDYAANALTSEPDAHDDAEDGEEKDDKGEVKKKTFPKTAKDKEWTGDSADDIADKVSSEGAPKVIPTKGPEDVREKVLVDREKIFSGEKTGKGGFDTTIQEEMANIGRELATRKDFKIPPPLAEQIIDEVRKKYPNSRVSKYNDKKIMTLAKRSSAGAKTMNKLKNKDKWGYNPNQPDGHPVNTTDNIVVRDNLITKLKEAEASGDEESIKHYRKELYFYQKKATDKSVTGKEGDADTMIIYTDNDGYTRVAYVTNKQTVNDQMSSSTINGTKISIEKNADKYFDKKTKAKGVKKINEIVTEQHKKSSQFNTSYCTNTKKVVKKNRKSLRKVKGPLGIAMSVDLGTTGKKTYTSKADKKRRMKYTKEAQQAPEVQSALLGETEAPNNNPKSDEYKKWKKNIDAKWKDRKKEYTPEETAQAVLDSTGTGNLQSIGNGKAAAPYSMVKATIVTRDLRQNVQKLLDNNKRAREENPDKNIPELSLKDACKAVSKQKNLANKNEILYGGLFKVQDIEDIYNNKGLQELEKVERQRGRDLSGMYDETTSQLKDEDAKMGITGVPPKNGPHTKAYVKGFLDRTHISDYISGDVDGRVMAEFGDISISPSDFRRALATALDYEGAPDDTEALEQYIMENVVPKDGKQELVYVNKNNEEIVIGVDTHRTGGRESKVGGQYGAALRTELIKQSDQSQDDINKKKKKK